MTSMPRPVRVFLDPPKHMSKAMFRVAEALRAYAPPNIQVVEHPEMAEIELLHIIGWEGVEKKIAELAVANRRYAIIQYCLRTAAGAPTCDKWLEIWRNAELVWSYYDLSALAAEDGVLFTGVNFYHSPLGCEADIFHPWDTPKKYAIGTSGYVAESEGVREAALACARSGQRHFHLGPDLAFDPAVTYARTGLNDVEVAQMWSRCNYVAGLRRGEGFELPAVEGILCGSRPVMFDRPHYRQWFDDLAVFIPEGNAEEVQQSLEMVFETGAAPVTPEEIEIAKARFHWPTIVGALFNQMTQVPATPVIQFPKNHRKPVLLWIGDAGVATGFARATEKICPTLALDYDVHILALNYFGDPQLGEDLKPLDLPYTLWPCRTLYRDSDGFGLSRIPELVDLLRPALIIVQNDPWNFPRYIKACGNVPTVGVVAVDGLNCRGGDLTGLRCAIFWTEFGLREAAKGGYAGTSCVIPLGVDPSVYYPMDQQESIDALPFTDRIRGLLKESFIIGNVNRNQPRKRLDLCISIFAEWIIEHKVPDARLFLHIAPTADDAYDIPQLVKYYGIGNRVVLYEPEVGPGAPESELRRIYNSFNMMFTTTQGEGWGLPALEAMACGKTMVAPEWAAYGEWAKHGAHLVPCSEIASTINRINVLGGIIDREKAVEGLDWLYRDAEYRGKLELSALATASNPLYNWGNIGQMYRSALSQIMAIQKGVVKG